MSATNYIQVPSRPEKLALSTTFKSGNHYHLPRNKKNNNNHEDVPGSPVDKSPPASAGDLGLSPGLGRLLVPRGF